MFLKIKRENFPSGRCWAFIFSCYNHLTKETNVYIEKVRKPLREELLKLYLKGGMSK